MCHIPGEFKKVEKEWLTVYKIAVETRDEDDLSLGVFSSSAMRDWINPVYFEKFRYHTIFTGSEIFLNRLMHDNLTEYEYQGNEEIGPGYYHFFKTKNDAESFLERIVGRGNFMDNEHPCILVGKIPQGELYNEGVFHFDGIIYRSIVSRTVYYDGERYYE